MKKLFLKFSNQFKFLIFCFVIKLCVQLNKTFEENFCFVVKLCVQLNKKVTKVSLSEILF